jgi:hypothetical protein
MYAKHILAQWLLGIFNVNVDALIFGNEICKNL